MAITDLDRYRAKPLGAGDGRPPGARLPALRRAVRHLRRSAGAYRQDHRCSSSIPPRRSTRSAIQLSARRHRRHVPGAGRAVADFRPARAPSPAKADARSPASRRRFAQMQDRARTIRRRPRRRRSCCWRPRTPHGDLLAAGPPDRPAGRAPPRQPIPKSHSQIVQEMIRILEAQRIVSLDRPVRPGRPPGERLARARS